MQPTPSFRRIAILGPGLLGASLALAVRRRIDGAVVQVWGRRQEAVDEVVRREMADTATTDVEEAVADADLIVMATPVGIMPDLARQIVAAKPAPAAVLTDVGSVKAKLVRDVGAVVAMSGGDLRWIGSHPMAGSERSGMEAADAELFEGATCVVTPTLQSDATGLAALRGFWEALGCDVAEMTPEEHDDAVARTSHAPHVAAAAVALASLSGHEDGARLAGGGLRDTTRIAAGSPDLWMEILASNAGPVADQLELMRDRLGEVISSLRGMDEEGLQRFLAEAKSLRDAAWPNTE